MKTMIAINIAELKSHLSKYLRSVRNGKRILVLDRKNPVAELIPPSPTHSSWEKLAQTGQVSLGAQEWESVHITPTRHPVNIQKVLQQVRED